MSKVPLHEYEKAKQGYEVIKRIASVLKWVCYAALWSFILHMAWSFASAVWIAGGGGALIISVVVLGVIATFMYLAAKYENTLERADEYGVIDE